MSLYEVVDIDRGYSLTVRDLIRETKPVVAREKLGSRNAALWDCLAARLVEVNGKHINAGAMLRFPRAVTREMVVAFDKTAEGLAKDMGRELKKQGDRTPVERRSVGEAVLHSRACAPMFAQTWMVEGLRPAQAVRA